MKGNEFIKRIRKYGKQHNMYVQWMPKEEKAVTELYTWATTIPLFVIRKKI